MLFSCSSRVGIWELFDVRTTDMTFHLFKEYKGNFYGIVPED